MYDLFANEIEHATAATGCIPSSPLTQMYELENLFIRMHEMYDLPIEMVPSLEHERTGAFTSVLQKEVDESLDVVNAVHAWKGRVKALKDVEIAFGKESAEAENAREHVRETYIDALVAQADWLTDLIVYALSEQRKLGLDIRTLLPIVMNSNFTKLGADGQPIKNEEGKVEKGPFFKKPEPTIRAVIIAALKKAGQY